MQIVGVADQRIVVSRALRNFDDVTDSVVEIFRPCDDCTVLIANIVKLHESGGLLGVSSLADAFIGIGVGKDGFGVVCHFGSLQPL